MRELALRADTADSGVTKQGLPFPDLAYGVAYGTDPDSGNTWDADRGYGCLCDDGYGGFDCRERTCPTGDDPNTHGQKNELQSFTCKNRAMPDCGTSVVAIDEADCPGKATVRRLDRCDRVACGQLCLGGDACGASNVQNCYGQYGVYRKSCEVDGRFRLTFREQTTPWLPHNATGSDIEGALEGLTTVGAVSVVVKDLGGGELYAGDDRDALERLGCGWYGVRLDAEAGCPECAEHEHDGEAYNAYDVKLSQTISCFCWYCPHLARRRRRRLLFDGGDAEGEARPEAWTREAYVAAAEAHSRVARPRRLAADDDPVACTRQNGAVHVVEVRFETEHGDVPKLLTDTHHVSTRVYSDGAMGQDGQITSHAGDTENEECSGRGLCDRALGVCTCFPGYGMSDGQGGRGTIANCGHKLPI